MVRQDDTLTDRIELRSTCSAHHLKDILWAEFDPFALFRTINLCSLEDHSVGRKVNTPSERGCRAENLEVTRSEEVLDHLSVAFAHSSVMNTKTIR